MDLDEDQMIESLARDTDDRIAEVTREYAVIGREPPEYLEAVWTPGEYLAVLRNHLRDIQSST